MATMLEALNREAKAGGPRDYVIKRNGELEQIEFDANDAVIPDETMYRCLELYGVATEPRTVTWEDGAKSALKLPTLLRIIDEADAQHREIMQVELNFDSVGPKSGFGQVAAAILGAPYIGRIDDAFWEKVIGGKFGASLSLKVAGDGRTFVNLVHNSAKPFKAKAKTTSKPKPVEDDDPFNEDDE
jgi:hypothetical protein